MGTIQVKEMTGGLDARRLPETTPGGVLVRADNGHITRGGEFQTRAAFVPQFSLPAGTIGLAHTRTGLVVFGSAAAPSGIPSGVRYQRLEKGGLALVRIRDWELFDDKIYAVAEYSDGTIAHFYDGAEVSAWQEARARVALQVVSGAVTEAQSATAQFTVTGGTGEIINALESLQVAGTELLTDTVVHTGNNATTAALIAAEVNAHPTTPGYDAEAVGPVVTLTAVRAGAEANARTLSWATTGNLTLGAATAFAGGVDLLTPRIDALMIDGLPIIREPVEWAGSAAATAAAVADQIMAVASNPEYEAVAVGSLVNIKTTEPGALQNGRALTFSTTGTITLATPSGDTLVNGAELDEDRFLPADVVLTVKEKLYAGAGSIFHMSAVTNPTFWAPDGAAPNVGAGFKNIAASNSSSYRITGLARYYDRIAVFTPDTVQTWFLDPDPDLVVQTQVLENTGTECPQSVTQFGDADIFYLDTSGLRSLRARDSSQAAATTDVGVPIDDILSARLAAMSATDRARVVGLINPADKRFWLIMGAEIFVYSFYPNSKVNAWTRYEASARNGEDRVTFNVDEALVFDRRVFLRSGDRVFCYGGWGKTPVYDDTPAVAWLPMLDAGAPAAEKTWKGLDAALSGRWTVSVAYDPTRPDEQELVANLTGTTYGLRRIPMDNKSTHVGLRFESRGGEGTLSALVIHFEGKVNED